MFDQEEFNNFIIDNNVVGFKEQDITLKSGRLSRWYANCRCLTDFAGIADKTANFIIEFAKEKGLECDYFYGVPAGATKLGVLLNYKIAARANNEDFKLIIGREKPKDHGEAKDRFFIGPLKPGDNVIAIEDVTTTGGSLITGIERLREAGVNVIASIGMVNRMEKRDDGLTVEEAIRQKFGIQHYSMSNAFDLLPIEFRRNPPSEDTRIHVQNYFSMYSIRGIELRGE
jgi:orotate phosphoribosyltransferase